MTKSRKPRRIHPHVQAEMFSGLPSGSRKRRELIKGFVDPDPDLLSVGSVQLREFLETSHAVLGIRIREIVRELDYTSFEEKYELSGRAPYHPAIIMGLVVYGILNNQGSLRQFERLATLDLGAHWITGGVIPDHTTIGRFLQLHSDTITREFFENLTRGLVKKTANPTHDWAIDGTIIESAGSRFQALKLEAARELLAKAEANGPVDPPDNPPDQPDTHETSTDKSLEKPVRKPNLDTLRKALETGEAIDARQRNSGAKGRSSPETIQICGTDPDAVVLKDKRGYFIPGYVASLAVGDDRMIYAFTVDSCSETQPLKELCDQATRVAGKPKNILMDTGYHSTGVALLAESMGVTVIAPPKPCTLEKSSTNAPFSKYFDFQYIESNDPKIPNAYMCPAGQLLTEGPPRNDPRRVAETRVFRTKRKICEECHLRPQCTAKQRFITRSEPLERLRAAYLVPENRQLYAKRKTTVEPVIGAMKTDQGLTRFRRLGKRGAHLDLALHACAHNIKRAIRLALLWLLQTLFNAFLSVSKLVSTLISPTIKTSHSGALVLSPN